MSNEVEENKTKSLFFFFRGKIIIINLRIFLKIKSRGKEYVNWGVNNLFPQYLFNLYLNCSQQQSIIDGIAEYVYASGITINPQINNIINEDFETVEDLVKNVIMDYVIFGGFNVQKITNYKNTEYFWQDFLNIRYNEELTKAYYSKEWGKYGAKAICYPIYYKDLNENDVMFSYRGSRTRGIYPISSYISAVTALETQIEIQKISY